MVSAHRDRIVHLERMVARYMRTIEEDIPTDHLSQVEDPYKHFLRYVRSVVTSSRNDKGALRLPEWNNDASKPSSSAEDDPGNAIEVRFLHAIGSSLVKAIKQNDSDINVDIQLVGTFTRMPSDQVSPTNTFLRPCSSSYTGILTPTSSRLVQGQAWLQMRS
jgi:hypothetical protein